MIRRAMSILLTAALFLLGIAFPSAHAQEPDSAVVRAAFDSIVAANTYTATLENGRLTGPGADWLEARG